MDCLTVHPSPSSLQKEKSLKDLIRKRDDLLAASNSSDSNNSDSESCKVFSNICSKITSQKYSLTSLNLSSSSSKDELMYQSDQLYQSNCLPSTKSKEFDGSVNVRTNSSDIQDILSFLDKK